MKVVDQLKADGKVTRGQLTDSPSKPRRHSTADQRAATIDAWQASGQSAAAFARAQGMTAKTLWRWIAMHRRNSAGEQGAGFLPVTAAAVASTEAGTGEMVQWQLPHDLGVVQGSARSLAPMLVQILRARHEV